MTAYQQALGNCQNTTFHTMLNFMKLLFLHRSQKANLDHAIQDLKIINDANC